MKILSLEGLKQEVSLKQKFGIFENHSLRESKKKYTKVVTAFF